MQEPGMLASINLEDDMVIMEDEQSDNNTQAFNSKLVKT